MQTRRVLPADIEAAVVKNNLRLVYGSWGDGVTCGCPLTQLQIAEEGPPDYGSDAATNSVLTDKYKSKVQAWADRQFGRPYRVGFLVGFDGIMPGTIVYSDQIEGRSLIMIAGYTADRFGDLNQDEQLDAVARFHQGRGDGYGLRHWLSQRATQAKDSSTM